MTPSPYQASTYEQQLAMALLAHTARHDEDAIADVLHLVFDPFGDLDPFRVLTALLTEFQRGMDSDAEDTLAGWFTDQALSLAADSAN